MSPVSFSQTFDHSIAVSTGATYRWGQLPKACVHPLTTAAGHRLTGFEMSDHVWHRGIWFAIKLVNGTNFWEENAPFGIQRSVSDPICEVLDRDRVRLSHTAAWNSEATGVVIDERRQITFGPGALDWSCELRAKQELTLDRTPYTTWGGYGGLSYRAARELHEGVFEVPTGEPVPGLAGQKHDWMGLRAKGDGGPNRTVSMGVADHPGNPRGTTPWYCKTGNGFTFWNAAFLFGEPMTVPEGKTLTFKYRIVSRDGAFAPGEFAAIAKAYRDGQ